MINSILQEMQLQKDYLSGDTVHTIYFGGGTPSLLNEAELQLLLERLYALFPVDSAAEITLEANPDDLDAGKLDMLRAAGINRLSIGVQSFHNADLQWMNRAHNSGQALTCIKTAQDKGFENITIDLIYGGPTLSDAGWQQNVETAISLHVPHLSCYALTVEPGTALDHFIKKKKLQEVDADKAARHFESLMQWLETAGYEHYEISNFALPGWHSRHNSSYWQGKPYLGLGPSAHAFNGHSRQWNVANNALYIAGIQQGTVPFEKELLTPAMRLNEYLMTSLRTSAGCRLDWISITFGEDLAAQVLNGSQAFLHKGWMEQQGHTLRLTREGRLFADGIASELFI